jgi:hypothetical protein
VASQQKTAAPPPSLSLVEKHQIRILVQPGQALAQQRPTRSGPVLQILQRDL